MPTLPRSTPLAACLGLMAGLSLPAQAAEPAIFQGADLALGARLIAEHQCSACHARKAGGDGSAIYRPLERINSPAALRGMVQMCDTQLNLQMFPEEVTAVAAVLNREHYRFVGP